MTDVLLYLSACLVFPGFSIIIWNIGNSFLLSLSLLQGLRVQVCNELLFLVYTECESVANELILAAPSIRGDKLLDLLTSLLPFKLRNSITDKVDVSTIPLDCATVKWLLLLDRVSFQAAHLLWSSTHHSASMPQSNGLCFWIGYLFKQPTNCDHPPTHQFFNHSHSDLLFSLRSAIFLPTILEQFHLY